MTEENGFLVETGKPLLLALRLDVSWLQFSLHFGAGIIDYLLESNLSIEFFPRFPLAFEVITVAMIIILEKNCR